MNLLEILSMKNLNLIFVKVTSIIKIAICLVVIVTHLINLSLNNKTDGNTLHSL